MDLFDTYRWMLAVVCTIYASIVTWHSIWPWLTWFRTSRQTAVLGRYTMLLLLRLRIRRHAGELLQIGLLAGVFGWLLLLHKGLEGI
jgi:hypothetical protein